MEQFQSNNRWAYNCGLEGQTQPKDLDYMVWWGDFDGPNKGKLTLTRNQLRGITFYLRGWNMLDGWIAVSSSNILVQPTNEPYIFSDVAKAYAFAKGKTNAYWGLRYIIEGILITRHGDEQNIVDEEHSTVVRGTFTRGDSYYYEFFTGCIPPDVP
jgi:hypothetical protein